MDSGVLYQCVVFGAGDFSENRYLRKWKPCFRIPRVAALGGWDMAFYYMYRRKPTRRRIKVPSTEEKDAV
jgi:hypothetical protein